MVDHLEEKSPIYKKWWFWVIIVVIVVVISLAIALNKIYNTTSNQTDLGTSSSSEDEVNNFLKNSNGKEFFRMLCEIGEMEVKEGTSSDDYDCISYSSSNNNYEVKVETNKSNGIDYISIYTSLNNKDDYQNFFTAVSRLDYETSDKTTCFNWINDNLGKEATTKIGDANFKLSNTSSGTPKLEVFTDGWINYYLNFLANDI